MDFYIQTERLRLEKPTINDIPRLFQLMSDEKLTFFLAWEPHKSIDVTITLVNSLIEAQDNDKGYHWCVKVNEVIIGLVSLIDVRRKIRTWTINRAELSYWISTEYQGKGYATEASRAIIDFGFKNLGLHKIIVAHAADNVISMRICKKLGFNQYAYEHDGFQKNHKWHDLIWYELI